MPKNTLIGDLAAFALLARPTTDHKIDFEPLDRRHREQLAQLYLTAYPPGVGAADIDEALSEMDATYAGDFGKVIIDASPVALHNRRVVGSIQVVRRSPWDPDLDCPFVIELFVHPDLRGRGIARSLLIRAAVACQRLGETRIALRTSDEGGTSQAAFHLYELAGMRPNPAQVHPTGPADRQTMSSSNATDR